MYQLIVATYLLLIYKTTSSVTLDIEISKRETCKEETLVSAIVENINDSSTAFLFSGQNVWTLNISSGKLVEVRRAEDVFPTVNETIYAAIINKPIPFYGLLSNNLAFLIIAGIPTVYDNEGYIGFVVNMFDVNQPASLGQISCSATYLTATEKVNVVIALDGRVYDCRIPKDQLRGTCEDVKTITNPNNIKLDKSKCEGLMIDKLNEQDEHLNYRLLYADRETLQYWNGTEQMYSLDLETLFGCKSNITLLIVAAFLVIGFLVSIIILGVVIFVLFINRSKVTLGDEDSFTKNDRTKSTVGRMYLRNTTATPPSGKSKGAKS